MYGIVQGMKAVRTAVNEYIELEHNDGILSDVVTLHTYQKADIPIIPPFIWIYKLSSVPYEEPKSKTQKFRTGYQFICGDYDESLELAEQKAEYLTMRCIAAIQKNFNSRKIPYFDDHDYMKIFDNVKISTIYPAGDVPIKGKSERVATCAVDIDFIHTIDWSLCKKYRI